jgi:hypothetical protein
MKFTRQVSLINFDRKAFENHLQQRMTETVREAARSWLTTVLLIIPTWSRASRATFEELAEAVGFRVTYGPIRSREDRLVLGLSTGRGGLKVTKTSWHFFYETELRYLAYNEYHHVIYGQAPNVFSRSGLINPTPYRFQEAGQADFRSFSQNVRLPNPIEFITPKRLP